VVLEVQASTSEAVDAHLDTVTGIMSEPIRWAPGLILKAEGFASQYYQKN